MPVRMRGVAAMAVFAVAAVLATTASALPGIMVNTSPDDYFPIAQMQLMKFNGEA